MADLPAGLVGCLAPVRPQVGSTNTGMGDLNHGVSWFENGRILDLLNSEPRAAQGVLRRCSGYGDAAQAVTAACAAVSMSCITSSGWETIARWFVGTSTVVAPMRLANRRSASGGIA